MFSPKQECPNCGHIAVCSHVHDFSEAQEAVKAIASSFSAFNITVTCDHYIPESPSIKMRSDSGVTKC